MTALRTRAADGDLAVAKAKELQVDTIRCAHLHHHHHDSSPYTALFFSLPPRTNPHALAFPPPPTSSQDELDRVHRDHEKIIAQQTEEARTKMRREIRRAQDEASAGG